MFYKSRDIKVKIIVNKLRYMFSTCIAEMSNTSTAYVVMFCFDWYLHLYASIVSVLSTKFLIPISNKDARYYYE